MVRKSNTQPEGKEPAPMRMVSGSKTKSDPLDRIIHERQRLAIVSALAVNPSLSFMDLKQALDMSDGNLSVHAQKLEAAGYITCTKSFEGRMPRTEYCLTPTGRAALDAYLNHMQALIEAVRKP